MPGLLTRHTLRPCQGMAARPFQLAVLTLLLAGSMIGCSSSRSTWGEYDPDPRFRRPAPAPRSLAMDAPKLHRAIENANFDPGTQPWYAARNDRRLTTTSGYQSTVYEQSVTYSYDRQSSHQGRVYDHFNSTTYRVRSEATSR